MENLAAYILLESKSGFSFQLMTSDRWYSMENLVADILLGRSTVSKTILIFSFWKAARLKQIQDRGVQCRVFAEKEQRSRKNTNQWLMGNFRPNQLFEIYADNFKRFRNSSLFHSLALAAHGKFTSFQSKFEQKKWPK